MTEWILSSSILILMVVGLRTVFRGKISLRLQYAIWGLVLLRLLIPVSFGSSNFSVANLTEAAQDQPVIQVIQDVGNLNVPSQSYEDAYQQVVQEYEAEGIDVDTLQGSDLEALEYEAYDKMKGRNLSEIAGDITLAIWLAGIVLVGIVFLVTNACFRNRIMGSRYCLEVRKNDLDVYATGQIDTPCLFGIRNPAIYVTYGVADDPTLLRHTLEHEATHHRHGDHIWAVLRCVCLAIHWYNPLVWWAAFLSQRDSELACDEATIKRLGEKERAEYGRTLIGMTCQKKANVLITATTMNSGKNGLKERIMLIAKKPKMALYTLLIVVLAASIAVGCTFTGAKKDRMEANEKLPEYLKEYSYEQVKDRMGPEEVYYIGGAYDYSLVYCSGMGPELILYRHEIRDDQIVITDQASGEYAISGGLSVNHIVDGDRHIYFGTISDYHWVPQDDSRIPLDWKNLVFYDAAGNQKIVNLGSDGYLCVMDEPMADFWVATNGGNVPLKMEQYLEQGYAIHEAVWYSNTGTGEEITSTDETRTREDILNENGEIIVGTEAPKGASPEDFPEYLKEYSYEQVKDRMGPEEVYYIGGAYDYSLVYCSGMGPELMLFRHQTKGDLTVITGQSGGEYAISGGLSVNHITDGDKHIYFGTISDYHWVPQDDSRIPLDWKNLVFCDAAGNQKTVELGANGYLCVMDEPMADFWVVTNGGNVPLKMEQYLEQGYTIDEAEWYTNGGAGEGNQTSADDVMIPEVFSTELDKDKVCITVLPTGISVEGGDYRYIIPENQEVLLEYYLVATASADKYLMWDNDMKRSGWWIVYQDMWWQVTESGAMFGFDSETNASICIGSEDARALYELCDAEVKAAGIGEPVRPEELTAIKSATLYWNGTHTVTDPYALGKLETWFSNSRETGSVSCWFTAPLVLELENGETRTITMATDGCAYYMTEGVAYGFGEVTNVGVEGNEEFYSLFSSDIVHEKAQEGMDAMAEYWTYVNFRVYSDTHTIDETFALMDMYKEFAVNNPTEWNVIVAIRISRGLDGAFGEYYGGVLAALYEANPSAFSFACRQMMPEEDVSRAVNMLAFYWNITPAEVREKLEAERNE